MPLSHRVLEHIFQKLNVFVIVAPFGKQIAKCNKLKQAKRSSNYIFLIVKKKLLLPYDFSLTQHDSPTIIVPVHSHF